MSICIYLQYGGHAMKTACANDAQAVLYLGSLSNVGAAHIKNS